MLKSVKKFKNRKNNVKKKKTMGLFKVNGNVIDASPEELAEILNQNSLTPVLFYASYCGHCVQFSPEYEKLADKLKERQSSVPVVAVDAVKYKDFSRKQNVQGYPTVRFYTDNENFQEYKGERKANSIIDQIESFFEENTNGNTSAEDEPTNYGARRNRSRNSSSRSRSNSRQGRSSSDSHKYKKCTNCGHYKKPEKHNK